MPRRRRLHRVQGRGRNVHPERAGRPKGRAPPLAGDVTAEPYGRQTMMLNLDDMDASVRRLKGNGEKEAGPQDYEGLGRFAWTRTPDGHDIEFWQP